MCLHYLTLLFTRDLEHLVNISRKGMSSDASKQHRKKEMDDLHTFVCSVQHKPKTDT